MRKLCVLTERSAKRFAAAFMLVALVVALEPVCAGAGYSYIYTITAPPNWALGNPQPVGVTFCSAAFPGLCGLNVENDVTVKLLGNPTTYYAYTTPLGASKGVIGSDVSIPTAQWLTPATYWWTDSGPFGGGMLAFFNSYKNGVFYANEMIVLDPFSEPATFADLEALDLQAGGNGLLPNPTLTTIDASTGLVDVPNVPGFGEAPEPASIALFGLGCIGISVFRISKARTVPSRKE